MLYLQRLGDEGCRGGDVEEQLLLEQETAVSTPESPILIGMTVREYYLNATFKAQIMNRAFIAVTYFAMLNLLRINYYVVRTCGHCDHALSE